ncbi:MAG TPA: DUF459 domain-containing protein [Pseudolabrys sp.]|jgi:hypothetical protein
MFGRIRLSRWLVGAALLAAAECAGLAAIAVAVSGPAQAQWFGGFGSNNDYQQQRRQKPQRQGGGFFQNLFGPFEQQQPQTRQRPYERERDYPGYQPQQHAPQPFESSSRAPAPRKPDKDAPAPTTSVLVLGDGMADWLAYGLEDAFSDTPEVGIIRKNKQNSGLLRYEAKSDLAWWHEAREILSHENANYVVMMLGLSDRQSIRERDLAKEADKKDAEKKEADKKDGDKKDADKAAKDTQAKTNDTTTAKPAAPESAEQATIATPQTPRSKTGNGTFEFRSDEWEKVYTRRIDDTLAALKSKGVPVFWVGLPSIRGTKSTSDVSYLNDLYRARAERAGVVYIDVWDGFVDEGGKYTNFGPDYEGQTRRLRSGDGVYFTKYGARKLAHYVERELRRYMSNRVPVALPSGPIEPVPGDNKPAARPLAGPVVPLTNTPANSDQLLGASTGGPNHGDAIATQVLVKGDPVYAPRGRADDFVWPLGSDAPRPTQPVAAVEPSTPPTTTAALPDAAASVSAEPAEPKTETQVRPKSEPAERKVQKHRPKRTAEQQQPPRGPFDFSPRPPQPVRQQQSRGPFDWFR